jgi:hypothetical protein
MKAKAFAVMAAAAAALAVSVGGVVAAPQSATLVIHHQVRGCHAWSLDGGSFIVRQVVKLGRGGSLTVTNNDLMVQELVKTNGPAVKQKLLGHMGSMSVGMHMGGKAGPYAMAHPGAMLRVTFPRAGVYQFNLMDRGDYFKGIKTIGPDNKPTLKVIVT